MKKSDGRSKKEVHSMKVEVCPHDRSHLVISVLRCGYIYIFFFLTQIEHTTDDGSIRGPVGGKKIRRSHNFSSYRSHIEFLLRSYMTRILTNFIYKTGWIKGLVKKIIKVDVPQN